MATTPPAKKKVSLSFPSSLTALSRTYRPPYCAHQHPSVLPIPSTLQHLDKFFFSSTSNRCMTTALTPPPPLPSRAQRPPPHHHTLRGTQANLPRHNPVTHATHRPRHAQPGRRRTRCHPSRRHPDYIASTSTPSPLQPALPRPHHHTLCGHASHPVAPALTWVAGTPCRQLR